MRRKMKSSSLVYELVSAWRQEMEENRIFLSCSIAKANGYFLQVPASPSENPLMGTGCEAAVGKINAFLESNFSAGWKMWREKKKIKWENSSTGQPTPQKRWGPCVLISPCTRQGHSLCKCPSHRGEFGLETFVCTAGLRVAIILGGSRRFGKYKTKTTKLWPSFTPWFNNTSVFSIICM